MVFFKKIWLLGPVLLLLLGCRKSTNANWDVDVVLPVVNSVLDIKNFVGDSLFKTDKNGLMTLSIHRQIAYIKLDSLLNLPDTTFISKFTNTVFPIGLQPGDSFTNAPITELSFNVGTGIELKRVDIRQGLLHIKFSNDLSQPLDIRYVIANATKYGPLVITETIPPGQNSLVKEYDLSGYSLNMQGISGNKFNTISQAYTLALNPAATSSVTIFIGQGAALELGYSEIIPQYAEGYFGNQSVNLALDTARVGLVKNFKASNFLLSDATMNFSIINEFGAEFRGNLTNVKSINTPDNKLIQLNNSHLSSININPASKNGSVISSSTTVLSFNTANSNITSFISNLPDKLTYQGQIDLNPNQNHRGWSDFAFYNTGIKILADINIPLRYTANYFRLNTNSVTDFSSVSQLDKVNYGRFVIFATNGFPFNASLQAYMYNDQNLVIDSLLTFDANTIMAGAVDYYNVVQTPTASKLIISMDKAKIENLKKCKSIKVVSNFIMPVNPPEIKILDSYQISVNIVAEVNYNVGL